MLIEVAARLNSCNVSTTNLLDRLTVLTATHNGFAYMIILGGGYFAISIAFTTSIGPFREKDSRLGYKLVTFKPDYTVCEVGGRLIWRNGRRTIGCCIRVWRFLVEEVFEGLRTRLMERNDAEEW